MTTKKEKNLKDERLKKLLYLKNSGLDPYPAQSKRTHTVAELISQFEALEGKGITLAGRLRALRGHGKLMFGNIEDESGSFQLAVKADVLDEKFKIFVDTVETGDIIELSGKLFVTKSGQQTLEVNDFKMLSKSLLALPEKFHGLKDVEMRLRKRYLDMIANPEVREMFKKKSVFWQSVREFMVQRGFLEVQTPVLEEIPGGADATPFVTHHDSLGRDYYLRISLELPLKRLLVGGFEKVFEIGRLFRNEGIDREHLQEYDDMEFYWAFADYNAGMELSRELFQKIIKKITGGLETSYLGKTINWSGKWKTVDYFDAFKIETGLDLNAASLTELKEKADNLKLEYAKSYGEGRIIDLIYKKTVRPKFIDAVFLINHPLSFSPLAKADPSNPKKVQRFQIVAGGTELGNGYSELNDPIDQKQRFEEQMKLRKQGDKEAQMLDEDFVEALEYGMPPAVGFGMSERLFSVLMDKPIRETVIFPPMRKEAKDESQ
jgi:lysyl-tRNA synthetase, class II